MNPSLLPKRTVICEDALCWLEKQSLLQDCSIVTSLPDFSEFPHLSLEDWKRWFIAAAQQVLLCCPESGVTLFYQTDLKHNGVWIDKGYLCQKAAEAVGHELLWSKVVCRVAPGKVSFGKPAYSHLLCFSKSVRANLSQSTADVLPAAGEVTWARGMGTQACLVACQFIIKATDSRTIVDPFCGHGTVLAVANYLGLDALGVDLSPKRVKKARALQFNGRSLG